MEACDNNKIKVKKTQEKKMYNSDNPACIAMLYRIVATPEERNAINHRLHRDRKGRQGYSDNIHNNSTG